MEKYEKTAKRNEVRQYRPIVGIPDVTEEKEPASAGFLETAPLRSFLNEGIIYRIFSHITRTKN